MRELLRANLRLSLRTMADVDRLAAAWPIACGKAMAAYGEVTAYVDGVVDVAVSDRDWMRQMMSMQAQIGGELGRIAGVRVTAIHFTRKTIQRG